MYIILVARCVITGVSHIYDAVSALALNTMCERCHICCAIQESAVRLLHLLTIYRLTLLILLVIHMQYIHSDHQWQRTAIAAFEFRSVAAIQDNMDHSDQAPYLAQACESNLTNLSVWLRKTTIAPSLSRATPSVRSFCCMETRAELRMKNPCTYVCMCARIVPRGWVERDCRRIRRAPPAQSRPTCHIPARTNHSTI